MKRIMIYTTAPVSSDKDSSNVKTIYYFSANSKNKIHERTIYNIKAAFPDNHKFYDLVDMYFHSNDELTTYDNFHKIMKINRALQNPIEAK